MGGVADMPPDDVDELGVALRRPDRGQVADCGRKRAIGDRHGPRRASEQDWLGQCAVNWHFKSRDGLVGNDLGHQTSATAEGEEGQEERTRRERDREAEYDLDEAPETAAGIAERQCQARHDDDDHRDDLGDRAFDRLQDLLERLLPRHVRAGSISQPAATRQEQPGDYNRYAKTETRERLDHALAPADLRSEASEVDTSA